ncbi:hypothetical protein OsI_33326 [Oryza sativa Indica Group]|uniref:Uncharacterized protein n=1 Tax=Oryza sativa subsp. indica TaxID=39946 RepID=B8BGJ7_ORYSI|nr:hypothetical protein OsI_33326 [Oryza sativa Indica Group]
MDNYGMDDRHMDGLEGDDDDQLSPGEANISVDADATTLPATNSDNQPSARRAECWRHFEVFTEMVDATSLGTSHLNRHYLAHLKNKALTGARQTQLSFGPDGSVSTWTYDPKIASEDIVKFIVAEDLPIRIGDSKHFERMIQKAFCPQYKKVSRKTTKNDITTIYRSKLSMIVLEKLLNKICRYVRIIGGNTVVKAKFQDYYKAKKKPARMFGIDVKHRWNTTMKDIDDDGDGEIFILTDQDWEIATHVRKFLKPFYNATVQLSGNYYPTACLVLKWIWKLALVFDENQSDRILSSIVKPME